MPVSIFCTHSTFTHCFFHQRLVTDTLKNFSYLGVPFGRSRLRIQHCHCNSSCRCGGMDLIPGPTTSACHGCGQKKGKKKKSATRTSQSLPALGSRYIVLLEDFPIFQSRPKCHLYSKPFVTDSKTWISDYHLMVLTVPKPLCL